MTFKEDDGEGPLHGYRGGPRGAAARYPEAATVAVSRQPGARGTTVARRLAARLGWEAFPQEMLEYLAAEETARSQLFADAPADVAAWVDDRLRAVAGEGRAAHPEELGDLPRVLLTLAATGKAVMVGRGAGFLLDPATTLHVRLTADADDRIAYMQQHLRMTADEAARHVEQLDRQRRDFLGRFFHYQPGDVGPFDLVINVSRVGEAVAASLIAEAVKAKSPAGGEP